MTAPAPAFACSPFPGFARRLSHHIILEFVAAAAWQGGPMLSPADAFLEAEDLLNQFEVLTPNAPSRESLPLTMHFSAAI